MKKISLLALSLLLITACTSATTDTETQTETDTVTASHETTREMEGATQHEPEPPLVENMGMSIDENAIVFNLTGENFKFMMDGQENPELRVKEGDTVVINFSSTNGFHDWKVDEFEAKTAQINTKGSSSVTFVAEKKGEFEYYCSIGNHRAQGMKGKLIVE